MIVSFVEEYFKTPLIFWTCERIWAINYIEKNRKHMTHIDQSAENRRKECHRFWFRLRRAVILISNDRTSASKKVNGMGLIRTLTISTAAFDRTKEKFDGFRQVEIARVTFSELSKLQVTLPRELSGAITYTRIYL